MKNNKDPEAIKNYKLLREPHSNNMTVTHYIFKEVVAVNIIRALRLMLRLFRKLTGVCILILLLVSVSSAKTVYPGSKYVGQGSKSHTVSKIDTARDIKKKADSFLLIKNYEAAIAYYLKALLTLKLVKQ